jgi:ankyrin repeat protein
MCELLVNSPHGKFLNYANRRRYTALHYAALGGHIRTVGKWLLEHGADFPDEGEADPQGLPQRFINDPLRLLVMKHEYADALWLLNFCHLHLSFWSTSSLAILYCRVLAALCHLKLPVTYRTLTLRERQDSLCNTTPADIKARDDRLIENMMDWTIERLVLARRLVKLGADPSLRQLTTRYRMPVVSNVVQDYMWLTPIEIAKRCEFTAMANLLENNVVGDIDAEDWDRWEFEALWIKPEDVENYFLGLDDDMPGESDDGEEERPASPEL